MGYMQIPKSSTGRFLFFFASELVSFFVISINIRALAKGFYAWAMITDMLLVFQSMVISKMMIEDEKSRNWTSIAGFTLGGACGSAIAIFVTNNITNNIWR